MKFWQTARRQISLDRTLLMAILNVTPDSFSDGGNFLLIDDALRHAERLIAEGADILDIGGESTRPNSIRVSVEDETARVIPVIRAITERFDTPISIDTTKSEVARRAVEAGAEIINDISGLRFDEQIAKVAAETLSGLVLMHSRGTFETMHSSPPVEDIIEDVAHDFSRSLDKALAVGVRPENIMLDIGIGFGKTMDQNLELLADLGRIRDEFPKFPLLAGTSRKSFIGKVLGDAPTDERLFGSVATAAIATWNGAAVVRVHDVKPTIEALRMVDAIRYRRN